MTIVEITASSSASGMSGTASADATSVRIHGNLFETRASRAASRSTAYTGRDDETSPSRESAAKRGPSPQPRSASASGPAGSQRVRSGGSSSMSKWIAVSVYRSLTRARLRAAGSAVARLAFTAADFEPATRALERAVSPLHVRAAAHADLDDHTHRLCAHRSTLGLQEDGYDDPSRRRGRVVRQRPAKPRTAVRVRSAP